MIPKHKDINVPLVGEDGNAFSILGRVKRIMRRAGLEDSEWEEFHKEATSGDYDNLLRTVMLWFAVDENKACPECADTMTTAHDNYLPTWSDRHDNIVCWWCAKHPDKVPCDECGVPIQADIHAEELGMCVECSNEYYSHEEN